MSDNKKSFVLYTDLIHTVKKMQAEKAGKLLLAILEYVNDEAPNVEDDFIVDLVFTPIKQQLDRDFSKWTGIKSSRSESGKEGGIKSGQTRRLKAELKKQNEANKANASMVKQNEANEAVNVNATVNDNEIDDVDKGEGSSPSSFFTIHNFIDEIRIGENEFTLLACRKTNLKTEVLTSLLQEFLTEQKGLSKIAWKNATDAKSHFINWACKQPNPQQGTQFVF